MSGVFSYEVEIRGTNGRSESKPPRVAVQPMGEADGPRLQSEILSFTSHLEHPLQNYRVRQTIRSGKDTRIRIHLIDAVEATGQTRQSPRLVRFRRSNAR